MIPFICFGDFLALLFHPLFSLSLLGIAFHSLSLSLVWLDQILPSLSPRSICLSFPF